MRTKQIAVLGAGESGTGTAVLAKKKGFEVFVSDRAEIKPEYKKILSNHGIEWEEEKHTEERILFSNEVVKSPGIPDTADLVVKLNEKNVPVISEIEFGGRYSNAKMICITGSNGKTTTALLTHHMLKKAGLNVKVAGNVGESFAKQVAEGDPDYFVVELSSFQLDGMYDFKADIAIILNITPDHLDRYNNEFQNYIDSKFRINQNQKAEDYFIYCADDVVIAKELEKRKIEAKAIPFSIQKSLTEGAYLENNQAIININHKQIAMSIHSLALEGKHNIYNSMASGIAARILELRKEIIRESLSDFQNVEHRLEFVATVCGKKFINDSKATNVNSTWYALESLQEKAVWIVGGVDKGNDYSMLESLVKDRVKTIICLGKDNKKLKKAFEGVVDTILETKSMAEAVSMASLAADKNDVVLLSPACASFDLFENYEDRGRQFKEAVRAL